MVYKIVYTETRRSTCGDEHDVQITIKTKKNRDHATRKSKTRSSFVYRKIAGLSHTRTPMISLSLSSVRSADEWPAGSVKHIRVSTYPFFSHTIAFSFLPLSFPLATHRTFSPLSTRILSYTHGGIILMVSLQLFV